MGIRDCSDAHVLYATVMPPKDCDSDDLNLEPPGDPPPAPSLPLPVGLVEAIAAATSTEQVLTLGAEGAVNLLAGDRGKITFMDNDRPISRAYRRAAAVAPLDLSPLVSGNSARALAFRAGAAVILSRAELEAETALCRGLLQSGAQGLIIAPMLSGGNIIGRLSVARNADDGFDAQDATRLLGYGKWIASQVLYQQANRSMAQSLETDALTGLANRARLLRVLDGPGDLSNPDKTGRILGLIRLSLDHFQEFNDVLGQEAGNTILCHAAAAISAVTGSKDILARIGADNFVVVTRTDPGGQHLGHLAHTIAQSVTRPLQIAGAEVRVGASIGLAIVDGENCQAEELLGNAGLALAQVKRANPGAILKFTPPLRQVGERRVRLLSDLQTAVAQRDFVPYFQPQVALSSGDFTGLEVLARWPHAKHGVIDPGDFLDIVDQADLSAEIDTTIRLKALAALRDMRASGWDAPKLAFNTSAKSLSEPDIVGDLLWEVMAHDLTPSDLVIELRQNDLRQVGDAQAVEVISALRSAGFGVVLDNFGAGFAALLSLVKMDITGLKLDRSLIACLPDQRTESVLSGMIALAHDLGVNIIAEGVEMASQFSILKQLGCDSAQGYGISHPLSLSELMRFRSTYGDAALDFATS